MRRGDNPVAIYYALTLGSALCIALFNTVNLIFQVTVAGLNPLQLILVGTALEAAYFLAETPTGIVADVYSRRLSVLIALPLFAVTMIWEAAIPVFASIVVVQIVKAVAYALMSGAVEAWITDEIGTDRVEHVFLRGQQMDLLGSIVGVILAGGLGLIAVQLPMIVAGVGMALLFVAMLLVMPETHMMPTPEAERSTWQHMIATAQEGFLLARRQPVARMIVLVSLITGLAAEAYDRLSTPFLLDGFHFPTLFGTNDPVLLLSASSLVGMVLALLTAAIFQRRRVEGAHPARIMTLVTAIDIIALSGFALTGNLWIALAAMWIRRAAAAIAGPVRSAWLNRQLASRSRATVISLTGQANAIGQTVGGPAFGLIGVRGSMRAALLASAALLSPIIAMYARQPEPPSDVGEELTATS